MSFLKKFKRKTPKEKALEAFDLLSIGDKAINIFDIMQEHEHSVIKEIVAEKEKSGNLDGVWVGSKGWYLPKADKRLDEVLKDLKQNPANLEELAKKWDLNEKRIFIALNDYVERQNLKNIVFIRKKYTIFLASWLQQKWIDVLSTSDFEEELKFENLLSQVDIKSEYDDIFKKTVVEYMKSDHSDYCLGVDKIIRRKDQIPEVLPGYVSDQWEKNVPQLDYEEIGEYFGLSREKITLIIQKLAEKNQLGNTTNYPLDEFLKPKN